MHPWPPLVAALTLATAVLAATKFFIPPARSKVTDYTENRIWAVGDTVKFAWQTDYSQTNLVMYSAIDGLKDTVLEASNENPCFFWKVTLDGLPDKVKAFGVFSLGLFQSGATSIAALSHFFNITEASTTTSTSSSTSDASSESATASSAAAAPSTPAADAAAQKDEGIEAGAVAGIAIGTTLGTALLVGDAGFLLWKRYRSKKNVGDQGQYQHGDVTSNRATMNAVEYTNADYATPAQQHEFINERKSPTPATPAPLVELGNEGPFQGGNDRPSELGSN